MGYYIYACSKARKTRKFLDNLHPRNFNRENPCFMLNREIYMPRKIPGIRYLFHSKYTLLHIKLTHNLRFSAKKISSFTVSGLSLDLPCTTFLPVLKVLSLGTLVAHTDKYFSASFIDLGKFSGVFATTVKVKTQHLIVD